MQRGDVVTIADSSNAFTGKPRPAVVVQSDFFADLTSVVVCPISSLIAEPTLLRLQIEPSKELPLDRTSWIEVHRITTIRWQRIGRVIGRLLEADLSRLNGTLAVLLGLG